MGQCSSPVARYRAEDHFILRKVAGSYALISVGENIANFNGYIHLNETAAFLWQQLQEPRNAEELVSSLRAEFEVSEEQAAADVKEFLVELVEEKMVSADG